MKYKITASIVTYKNDVKVLKNAIESFINTGLNVKLFISDNSPTDKIKGICNSDKVEYIYNNANLGFGAAHNIVIKKVLNQTKYHLILNPDVYFEGRVLTKLVSLMDKYDEIGVVAPRVLYPDGRLQYSCRLLPAPFDLFIRRVGILSKIYKNHIQKQELQFTGYENTMEVPFLLGCFLLIRTSTLREVGCFDESFFMYLEDLDLTRRISEISTSLFYPKVSVYHIYERGSAKKIKLMKYHIVSAIKYFNKWGWFWDKYRQRKNKEILEKIAKDIYHEV